MNPQVSTLIIGPLVTAPYDFSASLSSQSTGKGFRGASLQGTFPIADAHHLSELVDDPSLRRTVGDATGTLVEVWSSNANEERKNGWYLLTGSDFGTVLDPDWPYASVRLSGTYLGGSGRRPFLARSARAKVTSYGVPKAVVVSPYRPEGDGGEPFALPPGGTYLTREYDPTSRRDVRTQGSTRRLPMYVGTPTQLGAVAFPRPPRWTTSVPPDWLLERGGDVRVVDRSEEREVSAGHWFDRPTDLRVENGLLSYWVGSIYGTPYLTVHAVSEGEYRQVGYLYLADPGTSSDLLGIEVRRSGPDEAEVVMEVQDKGIVTLRLLRGEPTIRISHGLPFPNRNTSRFVGWYGVPPASAVEGVTSEPGAYANGIRVDGGTAVLRWPSEAETSDFAACLAWTPDAASGSQPNSGLAAFKSQEGTDIATLRWIPSSRVIEYASIDGTLTSPSVTFGAGDPIVVAVSVGPSGKSLTVRATETVQTIAVSGVGTGTYGFVDLGKVAIDPPDTFGFGGGLFSDGGFGGSEVPVTVFGSEGVIDNFMVFGQALSNAEARTLVAAPTALGGIPFPESRLVLHASLDPDPMMGGSPVNDGVTYHATSDGGSTRANAFGLTLGITVLSPGFSKQPGLAVRRTGTTMDLAAVVATAESGTDLTDLRDQFAAEFEQELSVQ